MNYSLTSPFPTATQFDEESSSEEEELEFVPRAERGKKPAAPAKAPAKKKTTAASGQSQLRQVVFPLIPRYCGRDANNQLCACSFAPTAGRPHRAAASGAALVSVSLVKFNTEKEVC